MKIALDAMGGDHAPAEIVAGAVAGARRERIAVALVGQPEAIRAELAKHETRGLALDIVPAADVIEMDDKPTQALKAKPDNSMSAAAKLIKAGEAQAFVTAGNTGGALTVGLLQIGRTPGIYRPALMSPFPTSQGVCLLLDVGANPDVRAEYLPQFAVMGTIYARRVLNVAQPSVYILSNGAEAGKGSQLVINAYRLLEQTPGIDFRGNIESKEIVAGKADVVVTDGFTGNVFIKTAEATAKLMRNVMRDEFTAGPISMIGGLLGRAALRRVKQRMDDSEYGGAVLLGVAGLVIVSHGHSHAEGIRHAIRIAKQGIEQGVVREIEQGVARLAKRDDAVDAADNAPLVGATA